MTSFLVFLRQKTRQKTGKNNVIFQNMCIWWFFFEKRRVSQDPWQHFAIKKWENVISCMEIVLNLGFRNPGSENLGCESDVLREQRCCFIFYHFPAIA